MDEQTLVKLLEKQTTTLKEEFKHHATILIEDVKKEIQIVAEGHDILNRKLDEHTKRLDSIDNRLDNIETQVISHERKLKIL